MTCIVCGKRAYSEYCVQHKPRKPIQVKRKPRSRGKGFYTWQAFRDKVVIPYLDKTYGHVCARCGATTHLDVDHIKNRGSHPELKYDLDNLQWLCRPCHRQKTDMLL